MSNTERHPSANTAQASRTAAIEAIRSQAKIVLDKLHSDVLLLIEEAHERIVPPAVPSDPGRQHPPASEIPSETAGGATAHPTSMVPHEDVRNIVRAELAKLDINSLVKSEVSGHLDPMIKLLNENLNPSPSQQMTKLSPLLSRGRR